MHRLPSISILPSPPTAKIHQLDPLASQPGPNTHFACVDSPSGHEPRACEALGVGTTQRLEETKSTNPGNRAPRPSRSAARSPTGYYGGTACHTPSRLVPFPCWPASVRPHHYSLVAPERSR